MATHGGLTFRGTLTWLFAMLAVATLAAGLSIMGLIWASPAEEGPWGMWAVAEPGYEGLARTLATVAVGVASLLVAGLLASIAFLVAGGPRASLRALGIVSVVFGPVPAFMGFMGVAAGNASADNVVLLIFGIALVVVGGYLVLTGQPR